MLRRDLLALTNEDLAVLSNRGTMKRALRELENNETPYEMSIDSAGTINIQWEEGVTTVLAADKVLKDCQCTCPTAGLCRHIIRGVLAYQREVHGDGGKDGDNGDDRATAVSEDTPATALYVVPPPYVVPETWNPGEITDDIAKAFVGPRVWAKAQDLLNEGQIVELSRGQKPFAKFHSLTHSIRYIVPHDIRYTRCDCADTQRCVHVALGILAFRKLAPEQTAGIINTSTPAPFVDDNLVAEIEDAISGLYISGVARAPQAALGKLKRCVEKCTAKLYFWPAEILNEVILEIGRYLERDSRYSSLGMAMLIAECMARLDAIKSNTGDIPIEFVRGFSSDKASSVNRTRLVGLGCGATITRRGTTLTAYIQDAHSGNLITVKKDFVHRADDEELPRFSTLGEKSAFKAVGIAQLAKGQLLIQGGNLSSSRRYDPGRAKLTFNHQSYQWENLRPPLCVDSFEELRSILSSQYPSYLSSRYSGRNFFVCTVNGARGASFNEAEQTVEATLYDCAGDEAELVFPFLSTCADGADALLHHLQHSGGAVRFIAGHVQIGRSGLTIVPVSLVFDDGQKRTMVQPWVDRRPGDVAPSAHAASSDLEGWQKRDILMAHFTRIFEEMGATITTGLQNADSQTLATWNHLEKESESLGFSQLPELIQAFAKQLQLKQSRTAWQPHDAFLAAINVTILTLIAQEEALRSPN